MPECTCECTCEAGRAKRTAARIVAHLDFASELAEMIADAGTYVVDITADAVRIQGRGRDMLNLAANTLGLTIDQTPDRFIHFDGTLGRGNAEGVTHQINVHVSIEALSVTLDDLREFGITPKVVTA